MKHYTRVDDFSKQEYLELCERIAKIAQGLAEGKDFTHLCPGKVMATMFFQESARTASILQSSIIGLGGGWLGIAGTEGTYIGSGEEEMSDFLRSYASVSDIMAIRHKTLELDEMKADFPIPLINAMSGKSEHTLAALGLVYLLKKYFSDLENLKLGLYGMPKSSRPTKAYIRAMSYFKPTFYVDPVIPEFDVPTEIKEYAEKNGAKFVNKKVDEFISEVDLVEITEGLPQAGEDENLVKKFTENYRVLTLNDLNKLKPGAYCLFGQPGTMTDGRTIATDETNYDERNLAWEFLRIFRPVTMALITYLLDVEVK